MNNSGVWEKRPCKKVEERSMRGQNDSNTVTKRNNRQAGNFINNRSDVVTVVSLKAVIN